MATQTTQLPSVVREIESNVEQLIAEHKRLTQHNAELILQRNSLQASRQTMQERITKLEKELALTQLKRGLSSDAKNTRRARAYINRLMREVDTCITLLSSQGGELRGGNEEQKGGNEELREEVSREEASREEASKVVVEAQTKAEE